MKAHDHAESAALAPRLTKASRKFYWSPYDYIEWPESIEGARWYMAPELISIYGTEMWEELDDQQRTRLSHFELGNFFSLTLHGERPLVQGLVHRLHAKSSGPDITDYLHHFIDEENKHMIMFGEYCNRYIGKVYPDKKVAFGRTYEKGEEEVAFFCKVLVVEELGDVYNVAMQKDERIAPLVAKLNWVHHRDEARHMAFGRRFLGELAEHWLATWSEEVTEKFREWLAAYIRSSWADFYNPAMYRDAGLPKPYDIRVRAMADPLCRAHRERVSSPLVEFFISTGLLVSAPEL
ncbi:MAG: hypothetical protein ACJAZN_000973 [Planctomycetota bacterium]|jgi:hypothetical protein